MKGIGLTAAAIAASAALTACPSAHKAPAASGTEGGATEKSAIVAVRAIAESFGDGEKVSAVIVEYPSAIDAASLSAQSFAVEGRTVESAQVGAEGNTVMLRLRYENKWDATGGKMPERPRHQMGTDGHGAPDFASQPDVIIDLSATVTQTGPVTAADGTVYPASAAAVTSTEARELVIEDFEKHLYADDETGAEIPYFVYLPEGYSADGSYPLVFFVPDASADTGIDTATLTQGNGATIWATPGEQAKHPAIVVAVQYPRGLVRSLGALTQDSSQWTTGLTLVYNLLQHVISEYAVDAARIYGTGQSQGCMANIALSDRYPGLFAAQYLVAGQWNVEEMAAMKDKNLWIVVCEGDEKAYPGMNAATSLWESLGATVARADHFWNPKADAEEFAGEVAALRQQDAKIHYTVLAGGSHMYTWSIAYTIEGIRDWLFEQSN